MEFSAGDRLLLAQLDGLLEAGRAEGRQPALALELLIAATRAERGFVVQADGGGGLLFLATRNFDREAVVSPELKVSTTMVRRVADGGATLLVERAGADPRFQHLPSVQERDLLSVLAVAVPYEGRTVGVLYLDNRLSASHFGAREQALAEAVAARLGEGLVLAGQRKRLGAGLERLARDHAAARDAGAFGKLLGRSPAMREVFGLLDAAAGGRAPVLLTGESGTGKELAARALHFQGPLRERAFVAESCASLPDELLESELFGYVRGAFSGAEQDRPGLIELAHGGTFFLDEVGEASPRVQRKLLRVLAEGELRPLGSGELRRVDVRIVTATNRDLAAAIEEGSFLADLYYRIAVLTVRMPPLRERSGDIPLLAEHFLAGSGLRLSGESIARLMAHPWPGNVRELANVLERAKLLAGGSTIEPESLALEAPGPSRATGVPASAPAASARQERQARLLAELGPGEIITAGDYAERMEVNRRTANRDLKDLVALGVLEQLGASSATRFRRR